MRRPAALPRIRSCQVGLRNPALVDEIKEAMQAGRYTFSAPNGRIGGWRDAADTYYCERWKPPNGRCSGAFSRDWRRLVRAGTNPLGVLDRDTIASNGRPPNAVSLSVERIPKLVGNLMDVTRLTCAGVELGSVYLPPFELRAGQIISLQFRTAYDQDTIARVSSVLTGQDPRPEVSVGCRVHVMELPRTPRGPFAGVRSPRAADWLAKEGGISRIQAAEAIRRVQSFDSHARVCTLAMTPRVILGILVAREKSAQALVYWTSGLDPRGLITAHQLVREELDQCPAIHLAFPHESAGHREFDISPGAIVVRLEQRCATAAASTISRREI